MKTPPRHFSGIFSVLILMLCIQTSQAGSATWKRNARSGDWNTKTNWRPATVPNGSADTAFFDLSNRTSVSISANTEVNGIVFDSNAGLNPYTITASPDFTLIISGVGITNNSGRTQNFVAAVNGASNQGETTGPTPNFCFGCEASSGIVFANGATAGSSTTFTNQGAVTSLVNGGFVAFADNSNAGKTTFTNNGSAINDSGGGFTTFGGSSSAADGTFINNAGTHGGFFGSGGGVTFFTDNSTAANGIFINNGAALSGAQAGSTRFGGMSKAGSATIINNGATVSGFSGSQGGFTAFGTTSSAGSATIIANAGTGAGAGAQILFEGSSDGGTSRIEVFGNGSLEVFRHNDPGVTIGSLEGDGNVLLGDSNLTIGSNNLSTNFSGVIGNGPQFFGHRGSLVKVGSGTLILSGTNTYRGNTNVTGGVLQIDGSITGNSYANAGGTLAGTGTLSRNLSVGVAGAVSPGDALGLVNVNGNYRQESFATLLISIAGAGSGESSILDVAGAGNLNGPYAILDPVLLGGFVPTIGDSFTFLDYASLTGTFLILDANIDNLVEHWEVTYEPTEAILTVAPGNVPIRSVPDYGSTLLLLTLTLLGFATYRHSLLREQA